MRECAISAALDLYFFRVSKVDLELLMAKAKGSEFYCQLCFFEVGSGITCNSCYCTAQVEGGIANGTQMVITYSV